EREMDRALAAGVSDYIVKPFHLRELALRVDLALERRAAALTLIARSGIGLLRAPGMAVAACTRVPTACAALLPDRLPRWGLR
ncbi:MAG: hypothetical protein CFE32_17335, partial [Alphaproteobacteria bacterium PA3]